MWCLESDILITAHHLPECQSGHRIQSDEGPFRLDVESIDIPTDSRSLPRSGSRPVRDTVDLPVTPLLQLETRPISGGDGCLSPRLEQPQGLCQPPMKPGGEGINEGGGARGLHNPHSSNMAIPAMVSQVTGTTHISTPEGRPTGGSYNGGTRDGGRYCPTPSRVAYLRQHYTNQRISGKATELLLSSWRQKSYDSLCKKWISWCTERNVDPVSGPIEDVVNFLAHLYTEGYQYRSLASYRSAIASMVDGIPIGQHPLVSRVLKGAFPLLSKYTETWDVSVILSYFNERPVNDGTSLKEFTLRTVMLLALTRPSHSADLSKLNLTGYRLTPEGAVFRPTALTKQSRPGRTISDFIFPRFTENIELCPVHSLNLYLERTKELRGDATQLFISFIRPHGTVTSSTIARWLKSIMCAAGIDTSIFKAHSVRSASTSAAATQRVTTEDILRAADWSTESSFQRFYYKPIRDTGFGTAVLSATNNSIDM